MERKRICQTELESMPKAHLIELVNSLFDRLAPFENSISLVKLPIKEQEAKIKSLEAKIKEQETTIKSLDTEVKAQEATIKELESKIKPTKNTKNSSVSPSTDLTRPRKNKGRKGKKGPPQGHKGTSLRITKDPDIIIKVPIKKCPRTGQPVKSKSKSYKRHQIIEIEPIKLLVIEVRRQITTGPDGKTIIAPHPDGLKKYKRYGPNLKSYISYLRFVLNIPWLRIIAFLKDIVGISIGIGTLQSIFEELKSDLESDYKDIQAHVKKSEVVGADETGIHLNGKKWWMHVFRTDDATLYKASASRGHGVGHSVLGKDFEGTLLSDFWGAYNDKFYPNASFQKCVGAHLIRDLEYAIECEKGKGDYARQLENVFLDAIYLKKYFIFETPEYCQEREEMETRLDVLLSDNTDTITEEGEKLRKRLRKYRKHLFPFLYNENITPDNNASERDIREVVNCRKISGGYRTESGIETLSTVKSVLSTMKKQGKKLVDRIKKAFSNNLIEPG